MLAMAGVRPDQIVILERDIDLFCDKIVVPAVIPAILTEFHATIYDSMIAAVPEVSVDLPKTIHNLS